jgi:hypothetical protein
LLRTCRRLLLLLLLLIIIVTQERQLCPLRSLARLVLPALLALPQLGIISLKRPPLLLLLDSAGSSREREWHAMCSVVQQVGHSMCGPLGGRGVQRGVGAG